MGRSLSLPGGVEAVVQVRGEETAGAFTLITDRAPSGWQLPSHRHDVSETIHVTGGRQWLVVGGDRLELGRGDSAHIPAGVSHSGGTLGTGALERVVVFAPAGMEAFFEELDGTADAAAALRLALSHGWQFDP